MIIGVDVLINVVFDEILHFLVLKILTLEEMNLQVLWDSGDEFSLKFKNGTVRTCGDDVELKIEVFVCHIISKTGK